MEATGERRRGLPVHSVRIKALRVEAVGGTKALLSFEGEKRCSPGRFSVGLTAIIMALALMLAGESFTYLKPYFWIIVTDYWMPVACYGGLAVVTLMVVIYAAARALGLADMGLKVDLMERGKTWRGYRR